MICYTYYIDGIPLVKKCKEVGLSPALVRVIRRTYNLTIEQAFEKCIQTRNNKGLYHKDGMSLWRYCKQNGISPFMIYQRMSFSGLTLDEALSLTTKELRRKKYKKHKGKTYREIAKELGIKQASLYCRVKSLGSIQAAIQQGQKSKYRNLMYKGQRLVDIMPNRIDRDRVYHRMRKGWDIEKAVETPPLSNWNRMSMAERFKHTDVPLWYKGQLIAKEQFFKQKDETNSFQNGNS